VPSPRGAGLPVPPEIVAEAAVLLLHLSFAVILAGASVTWLFGRQGTLHLRTGDPGATAFAGRDGSEQILPFRARLDDFRIEYYAGTRAPMDFVSLLTLTADDGSLHGEVGMNRILVFRNYRFYQSAYDEDGRGTTLSVSYDPGASASLCRVRAAARFHAGVPVRQARGFQAVAAQPCAPHAPAVPCPLYGGRAGCPGG